MESRSASRWRWLLARKLELLILALGIALRVTMAFSFEPGWSYDAFGHWEVVEWMVAHETVPAPDAVFEAFHPPLFYALAATLVHFGLKRADIVWVSIVCGALRLILIWMGLELFLRSRPARLAALTLAAVLAASVHVDGMIYGEPLSGLWAAAALLVTPLVYRASPRGRWGWATLLGVIFGLALLTKISNLVILGAVGLAAVGEVVFGRFSLKARINAILSWALVPTLCIALSGWYYARNVRDYGKPFVTSFDLRTQKRDMVEARKKPFLERRSLAYVFGFDTAIYRYPYYPVSVIPSSNFFSALLASTFNDYWNYSYSGMALETPTPMRSAINRPLTPALVELSRRAVLGGSVIALATLCAAFVAFRRMLRERSWGMLALLLAPTFAIGAALQFAIAHPLDHAGVVKGAYLQFAAPPLYALFGVAVAWAHDRPLRWPIASVLWLALWLVAAYSLYCRMRWLIVPMPY